MRNEVIYEWICEIIEDGDIVDSDFADKLKDLHIPEGATIGLVRDTGNEDGGLQDRFWAYVKDGKLPDVFEDSMQHQTDYKVPERFKKELDKFLAVS